MTPAGMPASISSSAMRSELREASSAGLSTAVQPVLRIHHWLIKGLFHGMMPPTTPTGAYWPGSTLCGVCTPREAVCDA